MGLLQVHKGEIYRIWFDNDPEGKSYVGQTVQGTYTRIRQHIQDAYEADKGCPLLDAATRKFGVRHMCYEILEDDIETYAELDEAEKFWIKEYNSVKPHGYNVKRGGQGDHNGDPNRIINDPAELFGRLVYNETARAAGIPYPASSLLRRLFR